MIAFLAKYEAYVNAIRRNAKKIGKETVTAIPARWIYYVGRGVVEGTIDTQCFKSFKTVRDFNGSKIIVLFKKRINVYNTTLCYA